MLTQNKEFLLFKTSHTSFDENKSTQNISIVIKYLNIEHVVFGKCSLV